MTAIALLAAVLLPKCSPATQSKLQYKHMQDGGQHPAPVPHPLRSWLYIGVLVISATLAGLLIWWVANVTVQQSIQVADSPQPIIPTKSTATPQLTTDEVVGGMNNIWEIGFLPSGEMLFTERTGALHLVKNSHISTLATISDVHAVGEGGLLGLAVDPDFAKNRFVYTCFDSSQAPLTIRVVRWRLSDDMAKVDSRNDIITDIPQNTSALSPGRHSGCRVKFGPDGYLWVGTGDTAIGDTAIQPTSLGGKILRVDRDGKAAPGNLSAPFDSRIYSYGHRNVQGLAFFPKAQNGVLGVNVEHGSSVDDEVNLLKPGNFGWAPPPTGYDESVKMTDKVRFPDAIDALWSSGNPTIAPSGATFLKGGKWKGWEGALAVAVLKNQQMRIIKIDSQNKVTSDDVILDHRFGRLRTAVEGPDGNLYVSTDIASTSQIIRITPH
jgi:aldose sugar dehydrogenase